MPNDKYFQGNPVKLDVSRCSFSRKPRWTGSWKVGELVPIFATSSIMPGDSASMTIDSAIRMLTPRFPTMDDMDITIEAFFVPHRLVLSRKSMSPDVNDSNHSWAAFIGAQDSLLNMPLPGDVTLPKVGVNATANYKVGSLADCLGLPPATTTTYYVNALKVLAYYSIWNEYFREPNCQTPVTYFIDNYGLVNFTAPESVIDTSYSFDVSRHELAPVSRYHGYFGSALPWPQRNTTAVQLPLGESAHVITGAEWLGVSATGVAPLYVKSNISGSLATIASAANLAVAARDSATSGSKVQYTNGTPGTATHEVTPTNLYADLSTATAASVNLVRLAFQTQKWYEHLARCGNKLSDLTAGMWGVQTTALQDRPEYLGGFTAPINISQVAATAGLDTGASTSTSGLGTMGAYSLSNPSGFLFDKSFTEHGTLMIVACCRARESFCQGVNREDLREDRWDFYWPEFANIGEQPILEKEIYVTGTAGVNNDDAVFGYQEAWAEYRMIPDLVTGYTRPTVSGGIGYVTYCNNFASAPTLKGYLNAKNQVGLVDNTLQVTSAAAGYQMYGQFQFNIKFVRPMPLYSIPGLIDHH